MTSFNRSLNTTQRKSLFLTHFSTPVQLYHRILLSFRDIEDLMDHRGVITSYERVRRWYSKFGLGYQRTLRRYEAKGSDCWYVDETLVKIKGEYLDLWQAVDQDEDVLDVPVQWRRDRVVAERLFR